MPDDLYDHAVIPFIAYGSLMSGLGLRSLGRLAVSDASRVRLGNCRRGFGKKSRHGDHYAMILEALRADQPIVAEASGAASGGVAGPEALLLEIGLPDLLKIAPREGYAPEAIQRLSERAHEDGTDLPGLLWNLYSKAGFHTGTYRARLFRMLDYTSAHYVPHPVPLSGGRPAVTFLPPGGEGSGSPDVVPVRAGDGPLEILSLRETWALKSTPSQLDYFAMCLLAGEHGISLSDVTIGVDEEESLAGALRVRIDAERAHERERFCRALGWSAGRYHTGFP